MNTDAARKTARAITACAALAAIALFFIRGESVISGIRDFRVKADSDIGARLAANHGLVLLAGFDEAVPADAVSGKPLLYWDAPRVPGRHGGARRIDLDRKPSLQIPLTRHSVNNCPVTFAAWFKPRDTVRRQVLFSQKNASSSFELALAGEMLEITAGDSAKSHSAACRFEGSPREFTHVALVFDGASAAVFQGGRETARLAFPSQTWFSSKLLPWGIDARDPFEGDIDDLAIWRRALQPGELAAIASSRRALLLKCEPWPSFKARAADAAATFAAGLLRAVGRLAPQTRNPAAIARDIPEITLWPSDNDSRHFLKAHESSLRSGYRTKKAASWREMNVSFGRRMARAEVALDDTYGRGDAKRMAFVVKDPSRTLFGGSGMVRLYPPELHEALHIDAPRALPVAGSFVRLFGKDSFKGLYLMEPFERTGSAWMARGERGMSIKKMPYYLSLPAPSDIPPEGVSPDKAFDAAASLVLSDVYFPWSRQEIRAREKLHAARRIDAKFDPVPDDDALLRHILADNPSAMYVTNDLALDLPGIAWESSDPGLVSPDGRVRRPASGAPRPLTLTPVDAGGVRGTPRRIRVVPASPDLQALFLHIGFPVQKHRPGDFACLRIPAGGGAPEWLSGTAGCGGGLRHRGNTSYLKGAKRSLSLKFDSPVDWPDSPGKTRHALLQCGYADPTRLRNKISFDSFRVAAGDDAARGLISVAWTEVFINGEYFGVWETSRRARDVCEPETALYKIRSFKADLWRTASTAMADYAGDGDPRADPYGPLEELFAFTSRSTGEEFARRAGDVFNLDSFIDYCLVLLFTENFDGQATNQYIARDGRGGKWFIVPWDYDKTFADPEKLGLSNNLVNRMAANVPGFREGLSAKWTALREGPMSDEAVLGRIDADAALIAPYMEEEYRLLTPAGWDGDFASAVAKLRATVAGRLKLMDTRFRPAHN